MNRGVTSHEFDRYVQRSDTRSTLSQVQQKYWQFKQTYLQRIKRQQDECVVSADEELDTRLELFKSIEETDLRLLCILEAYQERLCILAYEENVAGHFLIEMGHSNDGHVGDFLIACGKALCCVAQQRIQLQPFLHRMFDKMDTFHVKAFEDTQSTIDNMEKQRTTYRAALLWMKSLSDKLDPESMDQLSKFRKVQAHCRRCKLAFEQQSVDCVQKIEMLSASRCNLLGHSLEAYQTGWIKFWNRSTSTFHCIAQCFDNFEKEIKRSSEQVIERQASQLDDRKPSKPEVESEGTSTMSEPFVEDELIDLITSESRTFADDGVDSNLVELNDNFSEILEKALENVTKLNSNVGGLESKLSTLKTANSEMLDQFICAASTPTQTNELHDLMSELNLIDLDRNRSQPNNDLWMFDEDDCGVKPIDLKTQQTNGRIRSDTDDEMTKQSTEKRTKDKCDWFDLFSDLDPLSTADGEPKPKAKSEC